MIEASAVDIRGAARQFAEEAFTAWFPERDQRTKTNTLIYRMQFALCEAALTQWEGPPPERAFVEPFYAIDSLVHGIMNAARPYSDDPQPDFWRHREFEFGRKAVDRLPYVERLSLESETEAYLNLPVRSPLVDRTLIDMLVAAELSDFAKEVFGNWSKVRMRRGNGPLGFLAWRAASFGLLVLPAIGLISAKEAGWFSGDWPNWLAIILVGLFALETVWATIVLPFAWLAQIKHNKSVSALLIQMNGVYSELRSDGPISARHIRERAQGASVAGVAWPAPLFVLLEDIEKRGGKF